MSDIYQVTNGDTLESIAKEFKTTIEDILKQNNLDYKDELLPGTKLVIPQNRDEYYDTYVIQNGDSLYQIAKRFNINPELLAAFNGLNFDDYIYPNNIIMIPKKGYSYYLTAEGDTLNGVIDILQTSKDKLLLENETIYLLPGQLIVNKK